MPEQTYILSFGKVCLRVEYTDQEKPVETSDVLAGLFMMMTLLENGGNVTDPKLDRFKTPYGQGLPPVFWENTPAEDQGKLAKDHLHPPERIIQRMNEDLAEEMADNNNTSFPNEDLDCFSPLVDLDGDEIEAYIEGERSTLEKTWIPLPGGARKPPTKEEASSTEATADNREGEEK